MALKAAGITEYVLDYKPGEDEMYEKGCCYLKIGDNIATVFTLRNDQYVGEAILEIFPAVFPAIK